MESSADEYANTTKLPRRDEPIRDVSCVSRRVDSDLSPSLLDDIRLNWYILGEKVTGLCLFIASCDLGTFQMKVLTGTGKVFEKDFECLRSHRTHRSITTRPIGIMTEGYKKMIPRLIESKAEASVSNIFLSVFSFIPLGSRQTVACTIDAMCAYSLRSICWAPRD